MLRITRKTSIPLHEIELNAVRAQGPGGQNVNKVSSAVHLRFDIRSSSLPEFYKKRLLNLRDRRISKDGIIVIKAQAERSQELNRAEALDRLAALIKRAAVKPKARIPTRPTRSSQRKRLQHKLQRSRIKTLRQKVPRTDSS